MSRNRKMDFAAGIQDGIPICLGYIAVSFTFGIMAKNAGLSTWKAIRTSDNERCDQEITFPCFDLLL